MLCLNFPISSNVAETDFPANENDKRQCKLVLQKGRTCGGLLGTAIEGELQHMPL